MNDGPKKDPKTFQQQNADTASQGQDVINTQPFENQNLAGSGNCAQPPACLATGRQGQSKESVSSPNSFRIHGLRVIAVESPNGPKLLSGYSRRGRLRNDGARDVYVESRFA